MTPGLRSPRLYTAAALPRPRPRPRRRRRRPVFTACVGLSLALHGAALAFLLGAGWGAPPEPVAIYTVRIVEIGGGGSTGSGAAANDGAGKAAPRPPPQALAARPVSPLAAPPPAAPAAAPAAAPTPHGSAPLALADPPSARVAAPPGPPAPPVLPAGEPRQPPPASAPRVLEEDAPSAALLAQAAEDEPLVAAPEPRSPQPVVAEPAPVPLQERALGSGADASAGAEAGAASPTLVAALGVSSGGGPSGGEGAVGAGALDSGFRLAAPVAAAYPEAARRAGKAGRVRLELEIGPDGRVLAVRVLEATPGWGFAEAARRAYASARFSPPRVRGEPVRVLWRKTLVFRP